MKIILLIISVILLTSCNVSVNDGYRDASTQFIVTEINQPIGMKNTTAYYVEVVDVNGYAKDYCNDNKNLKFWFCDSIGKYKLGQPIHFDKQR